MGRLLKLSSGLIAGGLLVEMVTLYWSHPLAFLAFIGAGGLLVGGGVLVYLYALLTYR